jgi:hypothetical protein
MSIHFQLNILYFLSQIYMYKILLIYGILILNGCTTNQSIIMFNSLQNNCTENIIHFSGMVDFVYGAESFIIFDCPSIIHGSKIEWNTKEIEKPPVQEIGFDGFKTGKEYFNMLDN